MLLLDEPLNALDARLREALRADMNMNALLRKRNVTSIYVTHDQAEAMALAQRIVVMSAGRIEQCGTPRDIYRLPGYGSPEPSVGKQYESLDGHVGNRSSEHLENGGMLLAQITDLHIKRPGALAYRKVDTAAYLARCVARLNALVPCPDAVLVTGDLVDLGDEDEYRHLARLLAPLELPVYLMVGNHDDRAALRSVFDAPYLRDGGEFVQYALDIGAVRIIALDSQIPHESAGTLCDARLDWLACQLDAARGRPVIIALHHPPFATGIGHMDRIGLDAGASERLAQLIARHPNVERVLCGHLHRTIQARFAGTIASTAPSTAHQVVLDVREDAPSAFAMEPPAFALHQWSEATGVVSHHAYIDTFDGPYPFHEPSGELIP